MARRKVARDPLKVVGYVRVSTEEQRLGPGAQRQELEAWCKAKGAQLVAVHEDLGVSGSTEVERRPALQGALEDLEVYDAGVLLVAKRDRLARDVVVAAVVERLVEREGARVLAADGVGNGDGPEAELMRCIMNGFAQYERALIRSRTRIALAQKKARGEKTGGALPYGSRLAADGVHLEPDPREAAAVARARALRARGTTLTRIGQVLASEGFLPRAGGSWHPMTVARIVAA